MVNLTAGKTYTQHPTQTDFVAIAEHALREAQAHHRRVVDLEAESSEIHQRILSGYRWIGSNSAFHPKYERALELLPKLQHEHNGVRWQLRDAKVACMGFALTFWEAWEHLNPIEQRVITREHGDISHIERPTMDSYRAWMENWNTMEILDE